jgi:hypothetical protein
MATSIGDKPWRFNAADYLEFPEDAVTGKADHRHNSTNVRSGSMLSKKSQSVEELISRRKAKQAAIAIRWLLSSATEVIGRFTI